MIGTGEGGAIEVFLYISNPCRGCTSKAEDSLPLQTKGKTHHRKPSARPKEQTEDFGRRKQ